MKTQQKNSKPVRRTPAKQNPKPTHQAKVTDRPQGHTADLTQLGKANTRRKAVRKNGRKQAEVQAGDANVQQAARRDPRVARALQEDHERELGEADAAASVVRGEDPTEEPAHQGAGCDRDATGPDPAVPANPGPVAPPTGAPPTKKGVDWPKREGGRYDLVCTPSFLGEWGKTTWCLTMLAAATNAGHPTGDFDSFIDAVRAQSYTSANKVLVVCPYSVEPETLAIFENSTEATIHYVLLPKPGSEKRNYGEVEWGTSTVTYRFTATQPLYVSQVVSTHSTKTIIEPGAAYNIATKAGDDTIDTWVDDLRAFSLNQELMSTKFAHIAYANYSSTWFTALVYQDGSIAVPREVVDNCALSLIGCEITDKTVTSLSFNLRPVLRKLNYRSDHLTELASIIPYLAILRVAQLAHANPHVHAIAKMRKSWWQFWRRDLIVVHNNTIKLQANSVWTVSFLATCFLLVTSTCVFGSGLYYTGGVFPLVLFLFVLPCVLWYFSDFLPEWGRRGVPKATTLASRYIELRPTAKPAFGSLKYQWPDNVEMPKAGVAYAYGHCVYETAPLYADVKAPANAISGVLQRRLQGWENCPTDFWRAAKAARLWEATLLNPTGLDAETDTVCIPNYVDTLDKPAVYRESLFASALKYVPNGNEYTVFLKDEPGLKPRLISNPSTPDKLSGAALEIAKKEAQRRWDYNRRGLVTFACGMNNAQVGEWFANSLDDLGDCDALELDYGTFEGTQTVEAKMFEAEFVQDLMKDKKTKDTYLKWFTNNCGPDGLYADIHTFADRRTGFKMMYQRQGGRSSGSGDTTIGNTSLNVAVAMIALTFVFDCPFMFERLPPHVVDHVRFIVLGDDNFMLVTKKHSAAMADAMRHVATLAGFKPELVSHEGPFNKDNVCHGEFCSQRFYPMLGGGWILGPKLGKVLWNAYTVPAKYAIGADGKYNPRKASGYLHGVAKQYAVTHATIPILGAMAREVLKANPLANRVVVEKPFNDWSCGGTYVPEYVAAVYNTSTEELAAAEEYAVRAIRSGNTLSGIECPLLFDLISRDVYAAKSVSRIDVDAWHPTAEVPGFYSAHEYLRVVNRGSPHPEPTINEACSWAASKGYNLPNLALTYSEEGSFREWCLFRNKSAPKPYQGAVAPEAYGTYVGIAPAAYLYDAIVPAVMGNVDVKEEGKLPPRFDAVCEVVSVPEYHGPGCHGNPTTALSALMDTDGTGTAVIVMVPRVVPPNQFETLLHSMLLGRAPWDYNLLRLSAALGPSPPAPSGAASPALPDTPAMLPAPAEPDGELSPAARAALAVLTVGVDESHSGDDEPPSPGALTDYTVDSDSSDRSSHYGDSLLVFHQPLLCYVVALGSDPTKGVITLTWDPVHYGQLLQHKCHRLAGTAPYVYESPGGTQSEVTLIMQTPGNVFPPWESVDATPRVMALWRRFTGAGTLDFDRDRIHAVGAGHT